MSEEQPTFTVKDRRLFNPDGTPREVEREPQETAKPDAANAKTNERAANQANSATAKASASGVQGRSGATTDAASTQAGSQASGASGPEIKREETTRERASSSSTIMDESLAGELGEEEEIADAHDPASFINFLMSIASNAAASLGMMEHPVTGQRGVDLPLAKHWIDVLGMLQQKTRGNLTMQEQQIFEGLLADLRMQFVSLNSGPQRPNAPRGFTGRDIIGGK